MITIYKTTFRVNMAERGYLEFSRHTIKADSDANAVSQIRTMIADLENRHEHEFMARAEVWDSPWPQARYFDVWPRNHPLAADAEADNAGMIDIADSLADSEIDAADVATADVEADENPFIVWGFPDNRAASDKANGGTPIPTVSVYRSNPRNSHNPESIDMTPRQARQIAAAMILAADTAEHGVDNSETRIS